MKPAPFLALVALLVVTVATPGCKRKAAGSTWLSDSGAASAAGGRRKLTPQEADAAFASAAAAFQSPQRDCNKILEQIVGALSFAEAVTNNTRRALYAGARCAEQAKNYQLMLGMGRMLVEADRSSEKLAFVPRALRGLHRSKEALTALADLNRRHPNDPEVLYTAAQLAVDVHDWPSVLTLADQASKAVRAAGDPDLVPLAWGAEVLREAGYVFTGDLTKAAATIDATAKAGAPPAVVDEMRRELVPMKVNKIGVDADVPRDVYLGTYHLAGKQEGVPDVFHVAIVNFTGQDQLLQVDMEIPGVADAATRSVTLMSGKSADVSLTPSLRADFKPGDVVGSRAAQVHVKVTLGGDKPKVVYDDTTEIKVHARDEFSWGNPYELLAAWVTPQPPQMEAFMTAAKKRAPGGALPGSLAPTLPQVKAIYDELKARGFSYVLVSDFGTSSVQPVRLPVQSLQSTNALCIDGAVLFASLLEKIGLKPFLVLVPGHAFVGWHAEAADRAAAGTDYFLETTVVKSHTFESAMDIALQEVKREKDKRHFEKNASHIVDIVAMRQAGITPQPWD